MDNSSGTTLPLGPWVRRHHRLMLAEGILLLVLGALAILLPLAAGLAVTLVLGWMLFLAGVLGVWTSISMRQVPGFVWSLISSLIAIFAGAMLALYPLGGIVSLTLVLGVFLFADGVATILLGFATRDWGSHNWVWMLLNGVLDLVLCVAIFAFLPLAATWVVGTLVGIDLIFGGAALLAMVSSVKAD